MSRLLLDELREPSPMEAERIKKSTIEFNNIRLMKPDIYISYKLSMFGNRWQAWTGGKLIAHDEKLDKLLTNLVIKDLVTTEDAASILDKVTGRILWTKEN